MAAQDRASVPFAAWLPLATIPLALLVFALPGPTLSIPDQRDLLVEARPMAMTVVLLVTFAASLYMARVLYAQAANPEAPRLLALAPMLVPPVVCLAFSNYYGQRVFSGGCSPAPPELLLMYGAAELGTFRVLALALPAAGVICAALALPWSRASARQRWALSLAGLSLGGSLFTAAWALMAAQKGTLEIASIDYQPDAALLVLVARYAALSRASGTLLVSALVLTFAAGIEPARGGRLRAFTNVVAVLLLGVFPRALVTLETRATNSELGRMLVMLGTRGPGTTLYRVDDELSSLTSRGAAHPGWGLSVPGQDEVALGTLQPLMELALSMKYDRLVFTRPLPYLAVLPPAFSAGALLRDAYRTAAPVSLRDDTRDCFDSVVVEGDTMRLAGSGAAWAAGPPLMTFADTAWELPCVRLSTDSMSTSAVTAVAEAAVAHGAVLAIGVHSAGR